MVLEGDVIDADIITADLHRSQSLVVHDGVMDLDAIVEGRVKHVIVWLPLVAIPRVMGRLV